MCAAPARSRRIPSPPRHAVECHATAHSRRARDASTPTRRPAERASGCHSASSSQRPAQTGESIAHTRVDTRGMQKLRDTGTLRVTLASSIPRSTQSQSAERGTGERRCFTLLFGYGRWVKIHYGTTIFWFLVVFTAVPHATAKAPTARPTPDTDGAAPARLPSTPAGSPAPGSASVLCTERPLRVVSRVHTTRQSDEHRHAPRRARRPAA